jgi:hypothetical protein
MWRLYTGGTGTVNVQGHRLVEVVCTELIKVTLHR